MSENSGFQTEPRKLRYPIMNFDPEKWEASTQEEKDVWFAYVREWQIAGGIDPDECP